MCLFSSSLGILVPDHPNINGWILSWLTCKDKFGAQLFSTLLWKIWFARNQLLFKNVAVDPQRVAADANSFVSEYCLANPAISSSAGRGIGSGMQMDSSTGTKVFVDAGCFSEGGTGWGLVILDGDGVISYSACKREDIVVSPLLAEALGVRWALQISDQLGISNAAIFTDAETVAKCINRSLQIMEISPVIIDCLKLLVNGVDLSVSFVNRNCNAAAHDLARLARRGGSRSWTGYPSQDVFMFYNVFPSFSGAFSLV